MASLPKPQSDYPELFTALGVTKAIEDDGIWIGFVTLTPERAAYLLDPARNHSNRRMSPKQVKKYSRDMRGGRWPKYSSMMAGVGDGMTDGQTRAQSVLNTGITQKFVMQVREVGDEVWYDIGPQRSVMDTLQQGPQHIFEGEKPSALNTVAEPLAMNWLWMRGDYELYRDASRPQIAELLPRDAELTVWAAKVRQQYYHQMKRVLTKYVVCALIECYRADAEMARAFAEHVCTGQAGANAPASVLQRHLNDLLNRGKASQGNIYSQVSAVVYAFDAFRQGRTIQKVTTVNDHFVFPKGYDEHTQEYR